MQFLRMILDLTAYHSLNSLVYRLNICDDWADSSLLHAIVSSGAHAAHQQYLAVSDGSRHASVTVLGCGIEAMTARISAMGFAGVRFSSEVSMAHLIAVLSGNDLAILDGDDDIKWGSAKVLADRHTILRNYSDLHIFLQIVHAGLAKMV
jgi:hypothetical protein